MSSHCFTSSYSVVNTPNTTKWKKYDIVNIKITHSVLFSNNDTLLWWIYILRKIQCKYAYTLCIQETVNFSIHISWIPFAHDISRTLWLMIRKFGTLLNTYERMCTIKFQLSSFSNVADSAWSLISIRTWYLENAVTDDC